MQRSLPVRPDEEIVSEETIPEWTCRWIRGVLERLLCAEHRALDQVHIEVAVVVVIEQGDAGRHDLGVVPLTRHAVEVDEVEACLFGALDEPLRLRAGRGAQVSRRWCGGGWGGILVGSARDQGKGGQVLPRGTSSGMRSAYKNQPAVYNRRDYARMSHRTASTLLTLIVSAAALTAQSPEPKAAFVQAVGQFSLALDGAYGDEGARIRSSLDAMSRALGALGCDDPHVRGRDGGRHPHCGACDSHSRCIWRSAGSISIVPAPPMDCVSSRPRRQLDQTRPDVPVFEALAHSQLEGNDTAAIDGASPRVDTQPERRDDGVRPRAPPVRARAPSIWRAAHTNASWPARARRPAQDQPQPTTPVHHLRLFQETSGIEPFFPPALYVDGFAELQRGNLPQAIEVFRQSAARDPLAAESGVEAGALGKRPRRCATARSTAPPSIVAVAIELAPDRAEPHRIKGLMLSCRPRSSMQRLPRSVSPSR